jgi:hypothetical protein
VVDRYHPGQQLLELDKYSLKQLVVCLGQWLNAVIGTPYDARDAFFFQQGASRRGSVQHRIEAVYDPSQQHQPLSMMKSSRVVKGDANFQ